MDPIPITTDEELSLRRAERSVFLAIQAQQQARAQYDTATAALQKQIDLVLSAHQAVGGKIQFTDTGTMEIQPPSPDAVST